MTPTLHTHQATRSADDGNSTDADGNYFDADGNYCDADCNCNDADAGLSGPWGVLLGLWEGLTSTGPHVNWRCTDCRTLPSHLFSPGRWEVAACAPSVPQGEGMAIWQP